MMLFRIILQLVFLIYPSLNVAFKIGGKFPWSQFLSDFIGGIELRHCVVHFCVDGEPRQENDLVTVSKIFESAGVR